MNIAGKDVIVIDDAIESGGTMKRLIKFLSDHHEVKSLNQVALISQCSNILLMKCLMMTCWLGMAYLGKTS